MEKYPDSFLNPDPENIVCSGSYQTDRNSCPVEATLEAIGGRWCVLRAVNFTKGIDAFYKAVLKEAKRKRLSPDELVCEMITV